MDEESYSSSDDERGDLKDTEKDFEEVISTYAKYPRDFPHGKGEVSQILDVILATKKRTV